MDWFVFISTVSPGAEPVVLLKDCGMLAMYNGVWRMRIADCGVVHCSHGYDAHAALVPAQWHMKDVIGIDVATKLAYTLHLMPSFVKHYYISGSSK